MKEGPTLFEDLLENNDVHCGHIAYNEYSRILKYICLFCQNTYEDIEYFCKHLSEHIDSDGESQPLDDDQTDKLSEIKYEHDPAISDIDEKPSLDYVSTNNYVFSTQNYMCNENSIEHMRTNDVPIENEGYFDASDIIIEENAEEMKSEFCHEIGVSNVQLGEDTTNNGSQGLSQELRSETANMNKNISSFEDCFLKESNIEKIRSNGICILKENKAKNRPLQQRMLKKSQDLIRLRRKRKVTTVKVIAVKNRVAELYERIKNQQEKSQQILVSNGFLANGNSEGSINEAIMEQETQDALESMAIGENNEDVVGENSMTISHIEDTSKKITKKIIGETLITLIPEGTKIPNSLPHAVEGLATNVNVSLPPKDGKTNPPTLRNTSNESRAVCPACGKVFRSDFSLTIHKRIHYLETDSSVKLAHKCPDCDQLFNKLSQLKQHIESVHYPDGFVCKICNRKLNSLSLLERHMIKIHLDRPFNCQQCGKNFSSAVTYEEHIISHNSGEIYKCNVCGRKYSTKFFLVEHMRNHKEQIPQTCVVCGKITLRITQHMKIHTPRPKRLLSCSVCGKVFNFSSGLSHHFKVMHKLPRPQPKPKKELNSNIPRRKRKPRSEEKLMSKKDNCNTTNEISLNLVIEEPSEIPEVYFDDVPMEQRSESPLHNHHDRDDEVNCKEEEAKRVIVELIQNSAYTAPLFPDNLSSVLEVTPPIAREETISAVNSIVHDC